MVRIELVSVAILVDHLKEGDHRQQWMRWGCCSRLSKEVHDDDDDGDVVGVGVMRM